MVETAISWVPQGAWTGAAAPGAFGAAGKPGVTATLLGGFGLASIIPKPTEVAAVSAFCEKRFGMALPMKPGMARAGEYEFLWAGAGQWLLRAEQRAGFGATLAELSPHAAVSDQSDARSAVRVTGPRVHEALAKGVMVDLHPKAFPVGAVALSMIAYVGVQILRREDGAEGAVFEILVPRSFAGSFWSWFTAAAAEYGCSVDGRG